MVRVVLRDWKENIVIENVDSFFILDGEPYCLNDGWHLDHGVIILSTKDNKIYLGYCMKNEYAQLKELDDQDILALIDHLANFIDIQDLEKILIDKRGGF